MTTTNTPAGATPAKDDDLLFWAEKAYGSYRIVLGGSTISWEDLSDQARETWKRLVDFAPSGAIEAYEFHAEAMTGRRPPPFSELPEAERRAWRAVVDTLG